MAAGWEYMRYAAEIKWSAPKSGPDFVFNKLGAEGWESLAMT